MTIIFQMAEGKISSGDAILKILFLTGWFIILYMWLKENPDNTTCWVSPFEIMSRRMLDFRRLVRRRNPTVPMGLYPTYPKTCFSLRYCIWFKSINKTSLLIHIPVWTSRITQNRYPKDQVGGILTILSPSLNPSHRGREENFHLLGFWR